MAVVGLDGDDGGSSNAAASTSTTTESEPAAPVSDAAQAFAIAEQQLEDAGSFRYVGPIYAAENSALRPTTLFPQSVVANGAVLLPRRVSERTTDGGDTIHESIIVGAGFWERTSSQTDTAAPPAYGTGQRGWLDQGAVLLPTWLGAAADPTAVDEAAPRPLSVDPDLRLFQATLTIAEVGEPLPIVIALDPDDVLVRVWIGEPGDPFFLDWSITSIGARLQPIAAPGPLLDARVDIDEDDVTAAGIDAAVQLTEVPDGWTLAHVELADPTADCPNLHLEYRPVDAPTLRHPSIELDVSNADCATVPPQGDDTQALTIGPWSGHITSTGEASTEGAVTKEGTTVVFHADLSVDTTVRLLQSLAPFDPARQCTQIRVR